MSFRNDPPDSYPLGHSEGELERLIHQGTFLGELSAELLLLAGLKPGMRVFDAGSGAGDLSFVAARIVGPGGSVTGIDRSADSVALARSRAAGALSQVRFEVAELETFELPKPVDAVIGRLVLMYLPDPAAVVRRLARSVAPGGVVTFQEFDMHGAISTPPCAVYDTAIERIRTTFVRLGARPRMGLELGRAFEDAGLASPQMRLAARVERGANSNAYRLVTDVTRTLLPLMERTGVASAAEVDIATLPDRMRDEVVSLSATVVSPHLIGAWVRMPATP